MADDDLIALDKSKSSNPKPIPKPGSLKPASSSKKDKTNILGKWLIYSIKSPNFLNNYTIL